MNREKSKQTRQSSFGRLFSDFFTKTPSVTEDEPPAEELSTEDFPLLPLRDLVLFPQTVIPIFITFKPGIAALEEALKRDNRLFAACLKKHEIGFAADEPWETGTVVRIIQHLKLPDNTYRVVFQCEYRGTITSINAQNSYSMVRVEPLKTISLTEPLSAEDSALMRNVQKSFAQYGEYSKKISTDTLSAVERTENPERLANLVCNATYLKSEKKIELLGYCDTRERLLAILETLELENEIYGIQKNISGKVRSRMDKRHREYILHEQLREINKELGKDKIEDEFALLEKRIMEKKPPAEVKEKTVKEIARLRKLQPLSPEAGVLRGYLEWIADLPWSGYTVDSGDLAEAERILDEDHFGMKKAKDRILEFIAVRTLMNAPEEEEESHAEKADEVSEVAEKEPEYAAEKSEGGEQKDDVKDAEKPAPHAIKGPILCFVGPPGTGKTSLGKSVARALGRKFVRISLGGVRDEAEIRGHRKTYVGALPGKIVQSMKKAETINPVFLLDEIDKLSHDFRGDPASALLEVLDPEQNSTFVDHYMEVQYDLSKVMFITTANSLHTIPYPLLDRMEIIEIPGYGENEKLTIAKQFLVPKELKDNGLASAKIKFTDEALKNIIRHWTMESGVRSLERETARCIRRIAREAVNKGFGKDTDKPITTFSKTITPSNLEKILGKKKYKRDVVYREARIGVTYGLAWTETGGTILPVETIRYDGSGELLITGNLGDVMKESARIALSYLRSTSSKYNFAVKDFDKNKSDYHIHVPEGAIPKDGPSAGITLASSLLSTLCKTPPLPCIAMTGELTLTGRVLPIGGLKEKLLAAIRNGMEKVLLPKDNEADWYELDKDIRDGIEVIFAETAEEVFSLLFDKTILKKGTHAGTRRQKSAKK
uniref:Lon protease n=1 Tax=uncultured bacterium contig00007 TaxID=1181499 RepID=A0A806K263_9BACT|nr:ATP-dependent protease La Type I [uncultured bacterium contig00007]